MFKWLIVVLAFTWLNEAAISNLQLVVPDDFYNVLTASKSSISTLSHTIPSLSNIISDEDKSSNAILEDSNESSNSSDTSSVALASLTPSSVTASAPAYITRTKPASGTLLISSSAQASASTSSSSGSLPSSSVASARSATTIEHRILPAESIPLPITISTRPGLRTVIAPETLTIQQPGLAKVGEVVQQIPTAVSHQRQTVVHNHARIVTPIVAPAVRTVTSQVVRAYHTPLLYAPHIVEN